VCLARRSAVARRQPALTRACRDGYTNDRLVSYSMPTLPTPARQRRKQARPQELLRAALELFVAKGFSATRSDEVAAHAGVAKGTLYLYFPSKEELFKAVVRNNIASLIAEGQQIADAFEGSSEELLRLLMHGWWRRIGETDAGAIFKIIVSEVRNFPELARFYTGEVIVPAYRLVSGALQRGIDRGEFRAVPVREAAHTLIAPMLLQALHRHSVGACMHTGLEMSPTRLIDTQIDLMLRGLQTTAPATTPAAAPSRAAPGRPAARASAVPAKAQASRNAAKAALR